MVNNLTSPGDVSNFVPGRASYIGISCENQNSDRAYYVDSADVGVAECNKIIRDHFLLMLTVKAWNQLMRTILPILR